KPDTDKLQFHNSIRLSDFVQHWRGDVVNRNAGRCFPIADAVMCVTMEDCGRSKSVDRFFETTRTKECVDFGIFPLQRRSNWGIMQNHYPAVSLKFDQRLFETNGVAN